jgi:cytochrome c556
MNMIKVFAIGAILAAGTAIAQTERTDPNSIARSELMKMRGQNVGILSGMAEGKTPYDAAAAEAAKAALIETANKIETVFKEPGAADPASRAKPEIWTNWEDFLMKAKASSDAASALDVSSVESIAAGLAAVGGACGDCHKSYQAPKE